VALKLLTIGEEPWSFTRLAGSLSISVGAAHNAISHLRAAQLVYEKAGAAVVARKRLADFLIHGVPAVFFPVRGGIVKGIPTSTYAPMLGKLDKRPGVPVVWPSPAGKITGESLEPLYDSAPKAALADPTLYELLALLDGVRAGRGRERSACVEALYLKVAGPGSVPPITTD